MPYANLDEAFKNYAETFDCNMSQESSRDIRNDTRNNSFCNHHNQNRMQNKARQYGGATISDVNIGKVSPTYSVDITDPADDVPNIASNNMSDGYNTRYSNINNWNVMDPTERPPINKTIVQSPDRIMDQTYQPITQQRTSLDRTWDQPTSSEVDTYRMNQSAQRNAGDIYGGIGTAPRITGIAENQNNPNINNNGNTNNVNTNNGNNLNTEMNCSDDNCMNMINHIMKCDGCLEKFRKLLGVESGTKIMGMELPNINMTKLMFWVIMLILIVAVYELINSIFTRIFTR